MEWTRSLRQAINYMETHLLEDIGAEEVAEALVAGRQLVGLAVGDELRGNARPRRLEDVAARRANPHRRAAQIRRVSLWGRTRRRKLQPARAIQIHLSAFHVRPADGQAGDIAKAVCNRVDLRHDCLQLRLNANAAELQVRRVDRS